MPDEDQLFRTRPHIFVLIGRVLLSVALLLGMTAIPGLPLSFPVVGTGVAVAVFLLDYFGTVYEATSQAVTKEQGILWRREERIPIRQIQDLKFSTGFIGLVFGFGNLEIESAGTEGKTVFHALPTWAYRTLRPLRRNRSRR